MLETKVLVIYSIIVIVQEAYYRWHLVMEYDYFS